MMNINKFLLSAFMVGIMAFTTSCEKEDHTFKGPEYVAFNKAAYSVNEKSATPLSVTIGAAKVGGVNSDVTVTYSVAGNAVEGVDYTLLSPKTVTIKAGENNTAPILIQPINNDQFDPARNIVLTITQVSDPNLNIGLGKTNQLQKTVTVDLLNDDCPVETSIWYTDITVLRVGTNTTHVSKIAAVANGDCNAITIATNPFGIYAAGRVLRVDFIPDSEGAKTGKVEMVKQNIGFNFTGIGVLTVEGTGRYDEEAKEFNIMMTARDGNGAVWRAEDNYIYKLN